MAILSEIELLDKNMKTILAQEKLFDLTHTRFCYCATLCSISTMRIVFSINISLFFLIKILLKNLVNVPPSPIKLI